MTKRLTPLLALLLLVASAGAADAPPKSGKSLESQLRPLFKDFGKRSGNKIEIVSGPTACTMNRGKTAGREWAATFGETRFRLSIEDGVKLDVAKLVERLQKLPAPYMRAFEVVSSEGKNGVAVYADLGGAAAHGGKDYINIVPNADALVLAHESGHTLEQVMTAKDPKTLENWKAAIQSDAVSVSGYGDHVAHEDLAEFSKMYAVCLDAGPDHLAKLRTLSPARFALWEKILKG